MNRGKLYKLCMEYVKYLDIRMELHLIDSQSECPSVVYDRLDNIISNHEKLMLQTLQGGNE